MGAFEACLFVSQLSDVELLADFQRADLSTLLCWFTDVNLYYFSKSKGRYIVTHHSELMEEVKGGGEVFFFFCVMSYNVFNVIGSDWWRNSLKWVWDY